MDHSWGYASEVRLRDENQDCHGVFEFPDFTLAVVCDGMGGHVGGAQASAIAVRTIHDTLRELDTSDIHAALEQALTRANQAIYEAARKNHRLMGMGTTVVAAAITDDRAYLAHVGDSRAYMLRGGQVRQITRDHTMVNLFVDAELLTPEDAATHPEAHVLSRSLGVERSVDVELTEPVELQADDVVFLCSDGVHGVITDWELGNVDWGAPHEGVQHVMDIVAAREGDDNSTAVAVLLATSFEDVAPTAVPEPDKLGEPLEPSYGSQGVTAVPLDEVESGRTIIPDGLADVDDFGGPGTPTPHPQRRPDVAPQASASGQPSYIVYEEEPEPAPVAVPDMRKRSRTAEEPAADSTAAPQDPGSRRRLILVAALGLFVLGGVGLMGAAVIGISMSGATNEVEPLEPAPGEVAIVQEDPEVVVVAAIQDPEIEEPEEELVFRPNIPEAPRRLPHRPLEYTQPPPGGPAQWEAVQSARNHQCAASLDAVMKGMKSSIDHATLYQQAWFCFNETHQRKLIESKADTWEDFPFLLAHFEGPPEQRADQPDAIKNLPVWFQPPLDGIEYRLEAFNRSDPKDRFPQVMGDLLGDPTVADQLAKDVLLEAQAAVGLSKVEERNDRVIGWWARRVYATSAAMNGNVGRLLEAHRPEVVEQVRDLMETATTEIPPDPEDPKAKPIPVPDMVVEALETGSGVRDKPDPTKPKRHTGPVKPLEPDLDDLDPGAPTVHRGRDIVIESP